MKKSKFLSILLAPVLAIGTLVGCSSSKTAVTPFTTYHNMQAVYGTLIEPQAKDEKYSYDIYVNATNNMYYVHKLTSGEHSGKYELTYLLNPTYNITLLDSDNIGKIRSKTNLDSLNKNTSTYAGYYAVLKIQDSIVKGIYNYYNNWANRFYYSISKIKVDKAETKEFNKRMDNLVSVTNAFNNAKRVFEGSVGTAGGVEVHKFVFTGFCKSYNDLIESSISFVEYFKNLHTKYVVGNNLYGAEDDANRIKDEAIFSIARMLYYEDLKSFNYSDCDLSALAADLLNATEVDEVTNAYAKTLYKYLNKSTSSLNTTSGVIWTGTSSIGTRFVNNNTFKALVNAFNQKLSLYLNVYGSVDMYSYNRARSGYGTTSLEEFMEGKSMSQKNSYSFIDDFYNYTFMPFANYVLLDIN